mgnify:CR=1 FL=1
MSTFQDIFDILRGKKVIKIKAENRPVYEWRKRTNKQVKNLRKKVKNGRKIRVCFSVVFDSVFPAENIFKNMQKDEMFEPFILVIPDVSRGEENMFYQMDKTYKTLSAKYSNVYNSYDYENKEFTDWSGKMDMCFFANPYDSMTNELYTTQYISKYCLILYICYYYFGKLKYDLSFLKNVLTDKFWKIFAENNNSSKLFKKYSCIKGKNIFVSGYSKMDGYANVRKETLNRKTIILSPHHTVKRIKGFLNISNFLRLSDFYLELPKKYQDIDFIFRPHPLLFVNLSKDDLWGKVKVKEYIDKINKIPNMIYQEGGDYFQTFVNSSALIHDCGSFMAEYLYTGKPQCFILENDQELKNEFLPFGRKILENCYTACTEKEIIEFIDRTALNDNDTMKVKRDRFAQKEIMINYPNATDIIIKNIKSSLEK